MSHFFSKARQRLSETDPIYLCLFLALGLIFLLISLCGISYYYLNNYSMIPVMLFWGILLTRKPDPKACIRLLGGFLVSLWFVAVQSLHYASDQSVRSPGVFFLVYLLAFPFAGVARDEKQHTGLKMAGIAYIAGAMMLALYTGLLALDALPGFLKPHVVWDGARLSPFWQPNVCAIILMIALGFSLYFIACQPKRVWKALFAAISLLLMLLISLTNSRTGMMLSCCLIAGFLFFTFWKGGWKRFLVFAMVAVLVIALLFLGTQGLFAFHTSNRIDALLADENAPSDALRIDSETGEVALNTYSGQGTLIQDMASLNSRTLIWSKALEAVKSNPATLFRGTDSPGRLIAAQGGPNVGHAHNSWLEVLMNLGLPGLIGALAFTALAVWNILGVLFFRGCGLAQKTIALLLICLLAGGIMEPYLFCGNLNFLYTDFAFFLCLGYLTLWKKEA